MFIQKQEHRCKFAKPSVCTKIQVRVGWEGLGAIEVLGQNYRVDARLGKPEMHLTIKPNQ